MKAPKLMKLGFAELTPNPNNHRLAGEYFKDEEERKRMGKGILEGGAESIDPLKVWAKKEGEKGKEKEVNLVIGGNRRYLALETLEVDDLKDLKVPCLVYTGLTESEALDIEVLDNEHVETSPWAKSKVVARKKKLGLSQSDIGARYGWTPATVGNLLLLSEVEPWVREAGEAGKIAASLVLGIYNSLPSRGKDKMNQEQKMEALREKLNAQKAEIESKGVTAKAFNLSPSQKLETIVQQRLADKELEEVAKIYNTTYELTDKLIKSLIKLDQPTGELFFKEFMLAVKPLESTRTLPIYQGITGTLRGIQERGQLKVTELEKAVEDKLFKELLDKQQANTISPEERTKLQELADKAAGLRIGETEPPKTEPPKTEPPKTEPPKTEPPKTESPKADSAGNQKKNTDPGIPKPITLDEQIDAEIEQCASLRKVMGEWLVKWLGELSGNPGMQSIKTVRRQMEEVMAYYKIGNHERKS